MKKLWLLLLLLSSVVCRAEDTDIVVINVEKATIVHTFDDDEYTWRVHFPINVADSITQIIIGQKNYGSEVPFYYEVSNVNEGFFEALVDCEYDTEFRIKGFTKDNHCYANDYLFHPTQEMYQDYITGIGNISNQGRTRIVTVHTFSGKTVIPSSANENWKSGLKMLPKGIYIVTYEDEKGKLLSRKEAVR